MLEWENALNIFMNEIFNIVSNKSLLLLKAIVAHFTFMQLETLLITYMFHTEN